MMDGDLLILLCSQLQQNMRRLWLKLKMSIIEARRKMQKTDSQIFWGSRYDYGVMVAYYHVCAEYLCSS